MFGIIYCYTNKLNGKKYIGQTIHPEQRKRNHIHEALKKNSDYNFHCALRKYGIENFAYEVLLECESRTDMNEKELEFIRSLNTLQPNGYNELFATTMTEATRQKIKDSCQGRILTKEHKDKISKSQSGKKQPQSQKIKVAAALSEKWQITYPNGMVKEIVNLRNFATLNGLDQGNLSKVASGILRNHKGFKVSRLS
jgi:group I intron endonuclease